MKRNLELLKADILDELDKLAKLTQAFEQQVAPNLERPPEDMPDYDRAATGYYLHSFYNGCENIFLTIARFFENDLEPGGWHTNLLKRMKLTIPGYRPAVIDQELYHLLNDFRSFRHVFRHSYSFELDWERERLVAKKVSRTASLLDAQIKRFLQNLDELTSE